MTDGSLFVEFDPRSVSRPMNEGWQHTRRLPPGMAYVNPTRWEKRRYRVRLAYLVERNRPGDLGEIQQLFFLSGSFFDYMRKRPR